MGEAMDRFIYVLALFLLSALAWPVWALTYRLPPEGEDLVGRISVVNVREGETLIDIALQRDRRGQSGSGSLASPDGRRGGVAHPLHPAQRPA
jgi:hypothetical protein